MLRTLAELLTADYIVSDERIQHPFWQDMIATDKLRIVNHCRDERKEEYVFACCKRRAIMASARILRQVNDCADFFSFA